MANSALDRLTHHAFHIIMEGESYRCKLSPKSSPPSARRGVNERDPRHGLGQILMGLTTRVDES